ncbi:MAG: crossover junction endodeoxyribonuclease RuvC [Nitrospirae bacterium]|nr:crossover junction endodeoxyribonuclease RuvC [Nitrospirota bacterium]
MVKTVIGIDPGSINCGYGVVRKDGTNVSYVASGTISMPGTKPLALRLKLLYEGLCEVMERFLPDEAVVEKVFFARNVASALSLGHARGVVLLSASVADVPVVEYAALEVKKAVVGYGRAEKEQVSKMVQAILGIREALAPDSADALALALCHVNTNTYLVEDKNSHLKGTSRSGAGNRVITQKNIRKVAKMITDRAERREE